MSFSLSSTGSFSKTEAFLRKMKNFQIRRALEAHAKTGVAALAAATPRESGLAASSWSYEITGGGKSWKITWLNNNLEGGFPVAIMLQYGHGTGTGGYVQGKDYINPAMQPIFDRIADQVWQEVTSA